MRLELPDDPQSWFELAQFTARELLAGLASRQFPAPDSVVLYLASEPAHGASGHVVAAHFTPLAGLLTAAFAHYEVRTRVALCVSDGHWWSLTDGLAGDLPGEHDGTPLPAANTPSAVTVAFTVAGAPPVPRLDDITASFAPLTGPAAEVLLTAIEETARTTAVPDLINPAAIHALLERSAAAFADPAVTSLGPADTATLLLALTDRTLRDWAMTLPETLTNPAARRLFQYLATAGVHPHENLACAPLTLLALTAWYDDDHAFARLALHRACHADPDSRLPGLLLAAFNTAISKHLIRDMAREGRPGR
jgi:hypothetical protein